MTSASIDHLRRPAPSCLPSTAVLELTYACNHRCIFCSCPWEAPGNALLKGPELDLKAWKTILTTLADSGVTHFAFTGGEPTLKEGWAELVVHASACETLQLIIENGALVERKSPPGLTFLSNGKDLQSSDLDLLAHHKVDLSLSLPGLQSFHEHTGGGDPLQILRTFQAAKSAGLRCTAGITVTRKNLHELEETISAALLAGANEILLNRFLPGGRGLQHMDLLLDKAQLVQMLDVTEATLRRAHRFGSVGTEIPACCFEAKRYTHLEVGTGCAAARDFFTVGPNGRIRVCNHSPEEVGTPQDLKALARHPTWQRFALGDHLPSSCRACPQAGPCAGGCREVARILTKNLDDPDPLMMPPCAVSIPAPAVP